MTRRLVATVGLALATSMLAPAPAGAQDFSPVSSFELSDTKVKGNPAVLFHLEQDAGEEELQSVTLIIPKGFDIAADKDVADGEAVGSGDITIAFGPGCPTGTPATIPAPLGVDVSERDRTGDESKLKAVWVVDIGMGLIQIDAQISGSATKGHRVFAEIPQNEAVCPPFSIDLAINEESGGGTKIFTNPSKAGTYLFQALFVSTEGKKASLKQKVKIS